MSEINWESQDMEVLRAQDDILHAQERHLFCPAGLGSGKTRGLGLWAFDRAYQNARPDIRLAGLLVEPTYKQVQRILVRELRELAAELDLDYHYLKQEQVFTLHFGDGLSFDLLLGSADRPETLVGPNLCFVGLDEAGFMKAEAFEKTIPRVRHPKATYKQWLATGTPEGFGPYYEYAQGQKVPPWSRVIRSRTYENTFLQPTPEEYIATSLGHYSEDERRQYVEGEFIARGGRVYDQYDAKRHEKRCPNPFEGEVVAFADFGVRTNIFGFASVFADVSQRRGFEPVVRERCHIWGEVLGRRCGTLTQVEKVQEYLVEQYRRHTGEPVTWRTFTGRIKVYCDAAPNARADREILLDRGFDVMSSSRNEGIFDRVYSVNAKAKADELFVDKEGAPYIAQCLRQQGYNDRGFPEKQDDDGTGPPGLDHGADAVGYLHIHRWPVLAPRGNSEVHHWR